MALVFQNKKTGTLRAKTTTGTFFNAPGVNPNETSPENFATQVNKILTIGGKAIVADTDMTLEIKKGVVDNE